MTNKFKTYSTQLAKDSLQPKNENENENEKPIFVDLNLEEKNEKCME